MPEPVPVKVHWLDRYLLMVRARRDDLPFAHGTGFVLAFTAVIATRSANVTLSELWRTVTVGARVAAERELRHLEHRRPAVFVSAASDTLVAFVWPVAVVSCFRSWRMRPSSHVSRDGIGRVCT